MFHRNNIVLSKPTWVNTKTLESRSYTCGHCGRPIASNVGYSSTISACMYICHFCGMPTYFRGFLGQFPPAPIGEQIEHLPDSVQDIYFEACNCTMVEAYTASVLCSRKLLMHLAVSRGADQKLSFVQYVNYLNEKGYVPPDGREWVDHIRNIGNMVNHEISIMTREQAEELLDFAGMLLKFIYEFPEKMKAKKQPPPTTATNVIP
jgi:hypothetical protein